MVIDEFIVNIGASTSAFESSVDGLLKKLDGLDLSAKNIGFALGSAALIGGGALLAITKNAIDYQSAIHSASLATGVSAESLSVFSVAGKKAGLSLGDLQGGLAKLGVAAANNKDAFQKFGISVLDAGGNVKNSDKLILEMSERMRDTSKETISTADVIAVLGRDGARWMEFLGTNFKTAEERAKAFGLVVSGSAASSAESLGDAIDELKEPFLGMGLVIANQVVPWILRFTESVGSAQGGTSLFIKVADSAIFVFKSLASAAVIAVTAFEQAGIVIADVAEALYLIATGEPKKAIDLLSQGYRDFIKSGQDAAKVINDIWRETTAEEQAQLKLSLSVKAQTRAEKDSIKSKKEADKAAKDSGNQIAELSDEVDGCSEAFSDLGFSAKDAARMWGAAVKKGADEAEAALKSTQDEMKESAKAYIKMVGDSKTPSQNYVDNIDNMLNKWEVFGGDVGTQQRLALNLTQGFRDETGSLLGKDGGASKSIIDMGGVWSDFKVGLSTTITEILDEGGSFKDKMGAIFTEIGQTIQKTLIAALIDVAAKWAVLQGLDALGLGTSTTGIAGQLAAWAKPAATTTASTSTTTTAAGTTGALPVVGTILAAAAATEAGHEQIGDKFGTAAANAVTVVAAPYVAAYGAATSIGDSIADVFGWAKGGIVTEPSLGWVGEGGQSEAIIPLDRMDEFLRPQQNSGGSQTIIINLDGKQIAKQVVERMPSILRLQGIAV